MIGIILIMVLFLAHLYFKPNIELNEDEQIIIHYWWRGKRKTYIL